MSKDRFQQVLRSAVVQGERPLTNAPQRSSTKFVRPGVALSDVIRKAGSHMVNGKIGEEVRLLLIERLDGGSIKSCGRSDGGLAPSRQKPKLTIERVGGFLGMIAVLLSLPGAFLNIHDLLWPSARTTAWTNHQTSPLTLTYSRERRELGADAQFFISNTGSTEEIIDSAAARLEMRTTKQLLLRFSQISDITFFSAGKKIDLFVLAKGETRPIEAVLNTALRPDELYAWPNGSVQLRWKLG